MFWKTEMSENFLNVVKIGDINAPVKRVQFAIAVSINLGTQTF